MARYEEFSVGLLRVRSIAAPTENIANVTQATSRSTGVTVNAYQGAITTNAASLAASAQAAFTVTNSKVNANSIVLVSIQSGGGTTGLTIPVVTTIAAGSFVITLTNVHTATADTTASVINFFVINGNP